MGASSVAATRVLRDRLIRNTIANALLTPFYQGHWQNVDPLAIISEDLESVLGALPVVRKQDIVAAGRDAQVRDGLVCNEVFTSGTSGVPLVTVRGNREQAFIGQMFSTLVIGGDGLRLRGLRINNPYHGYQVPIPLPVHLHSIGIYDAGSFRHGLDVLTRSHDDHGVETNCSLLLGLERCLRAFTLFVESQKPPLSLNLRCVVSYSQFLTRTWNQRLRRTWGCDVIDRFSLAEVFGGATSCLKCGWWHFDPQLIAEVVSASTMHPIEEGIGILLLTPLHPFQEAQPLVRYWTGDLVAVSHATPCEPGLAAIRPHGRASAGVPDARECSGDCDDWLVIPSTIYEILDGLLEIERLPRFLDSEQVVDNYIIGHPKYRISFEDHCGRRYIRLEIELRRDVTYCDKMRVIEHVRRGILANNALLNLALEQGRARLDIAIEDNLIPSLISHSE